MHADSNTQKKPPKIVKIQNSKGFKRVINKTPVKPTQKFAQTSSSAPNQANDILQKYKMTDTLFTSHKFKNVKVIPEKQFKPVKTTTHSAKPTHTRINTKALPKSIFGQTNQHSKPYNASYPYSSFGRNTPPPKQTRPTPQSEKPTPKPKRNSSYKPAFVVRTVQIHDGMTSTTLAQRLAITTKKLKQVLRSIGADETHTISQDVAVLATESVGHIPKVETNTRDLILADSGTETDYVQRPPIITVVGHVDHGKTSLLDAIRKTNVLKDEAGSITQGIGASYIVTADKKHLTLIDTPGHAAFSKMRSLGTTITDIVILVVAADESVQAQTIEAIQHIQSSSAEIIVAITKIDKPNANPTKVQEQLTNYDIITEEMGGDCLCVCVSAHTGQNLDQLLDTIFIQAEAMDLKANPKCKASGVVLEACLHPQQGPLATLVVTNGTLKKGDAIFSYDTYGKIKSMVDWKNQSMKTATPSTPVQIMGLKDTPAAGQQFLVCKDIKEAKQFYDTKETKAAATQQIKPSSESADLFSNVEEDAPVEIKIILKSSTHGSLDAVSNALQQLQTDTEKIDIIYTNVGAINENDINLAKITEAKIVAFDLSTTSAINKLLQANKIEVFSHKIIYEITQMLETHIHKLRGPEEEVTTIGEALVKQIFDHSKIGLIAGCVVQSGKMLQGKKIAVIRDDREIHRTSVKSLYHQQDARKEIHTNQECGITLNKFDNIQEGDILRCIEVSTR